MSSTQCFRNALVAMVAGAAIVTSGNAQATPSLTNGGFEYGQAPGSYNFYQDASVNPSGGWLTTESDHQIEVWGSGFLGVPAHEGSNFVELNAYVPSTLYQDVAGIAAGSIVGFQFAHRGRQGNDTMAFKVTDDVTGSVLFSQNYTDGTAAWGFYSGSGIVATGNALRFSYVSVSSVGGDAIGNFLDDAAFGVGVGATEVPEPASLGVLGVGLLGLVAVRRHSRGQGIWPRRSCA